MKSTRNIEKAFDELREQIAELEKLRETAEDLTQRHVYLQCWEVINDVWFLKDCTGAQLLQNVEKQELTIQGVIDYLERLPDDTLIHCSNGVCLEWLHLFPWRREAPGYTEEQLETFKERDIDKHPELAILWETDEGDRLRDILLNAPQYYRTVTAREFVKTLNNIIF